MLHLCCYLPSVERARVRSGNCCGWGWTWRWGPGSLVPDRCSWVLEGSEEGEEAACQTEGQSLAAVNRVEQRVLFLVIYAFHVPRKIAPKATGTGSQDPRGLQQVTVRTSSVGQGLPPFRSASRRQWKDWPRPAESHFITRAPGNPRVFYIRGETRCQHL